MKIVAAINTEYHNPDHPRGHFGRARAEVALDTVTTICNGNGYSAVVLDRSTLDGFTEDLIKTGAVVQQFAAEAPQAEQKVAGVKLALEQGADIVVVCEPEKVGLVPFYAALVDRLEQTNADVVVARRKSMDSYPPFQQKIEELGNELFSELTGMDIDVWFGGIVLSKAGAQNFIEHAVQDGQTMEPLFSHLIRAQQKGLRIEELGIDYQHPSKQTKADTKKRVEKTRRVKQLYDMMNYLIDITGN